MGAVPLCQVQAFAVATGKLLGLAVPPVTIDRTYRVKNKLCGKRSSAGNYGAAGGTTTRARANRKPAFAALTIASTRILVISPTTRRSFLPLGKLISIPL